MRDITFWNNENKEVPGEIKEQTWDRYLGCMAFRVEHYPNHTSSLVVYDEVDKKHKTWTRFTTDLILREWKKDITHSFAQAVVAQKENEAK